MERTEIADAGETKDSAQPSGKPQVTNGPPQTTVDPVATEQIVDEKRRIADEKQKNAENKQRIVNEERKRALHPQTGTEADMLWSTTVRKDDAVQLLDLELAWSELGDAVPISVPHNEPEVPGDSVDNRNAALLARELKGYIIATCSNEQRKKKSTNYQINSDGKGDPESENDGEKAEWLAPIPDMAEQITTEGEEEENEDDDGSLKSTYGSSILLKLQWEYRAPQKEVPEMDYDQLALFICDISLNLTDAFDKNPTAAQLVLDLIALDMAPLLMARYIAALEVEHATLADSTFALLKLCATTANPKEMHVAVKTFLSKIDRIYTEATSYLCLHPLIQLWAEVIPRVKTKRKALLIDMVKHVERMLASAETYEASFVPDEGIGIERPGRLLAIPDVLLDFYEKLIAAQQKQIEGATSIRVQFDYLGRLKPVADDVPSDADTNAGDDQKLKGETAAAKEGPAQKSGFEKKAAAATTKENSADLIRERAVTLAKALILFGMLWMRLPAPAGEMQKNPKRKMKRKGNPKKGEVPLKVKEESIDRCLKLFPLLGWSDPVLVCQLATDEMGLIHAQRAGELMKEHIGHEVLSRSAMKHSTYSLNSVGFYVSGTLRHVTMTCSEQGKVSTAETKDLASTAFHFLDPSYALDLVLPFLLPTIGHSNIAVSVRGIVTLGAFLRRLPDNAFRTLDDVLRLRSGTGSGGRDVNILGLLQGLSRALPGLDDPEYRRIAYEAIQMILRKCESPVARYVMTEVLYYNANNSVVSSQFMTELKDAVMYSDSIASSSRKEEWPLIQASRIRWRFAQDCFGKTFLPRKELLSFRHQLSTASSLMYFLMARDKGLLKCAGESDEELREDILHRQRFCKAYALLGRDCIRALAAIAEHDRKNLPSSALAKRNRADAMALYQVSGLTLNQCVYAVSFLESALDLL